MVLYFKPDSSGFNYWLRKDEPVKPRKDTANKKAAAFVPVVKTQTIQTGLSLHYLMAACYKV